MVDGALGWLLAQPHVQSLIVGATSPQQVVRTVGELQTQRVAWARRGGEHTVSSVERGASRARPPRSCALMDARVCAMRWALAPPRVICRRYIPTCPQRGRDSGAAANRGHRGAQSCVRHGVRPLAARWSEPLPLTRCSVPCLCSRPV